MVAADEEKLRAFVVDHVDVGIFAVDGDLTIVMWNRFMEIHGRIPAADVVGRKLFEAFPDLPRKWLEKKIRSVFTLGNFAFSNWEQRPWLFDFPHDRYITGGVDRMRQNLTFMPVKADDGTTRQVVVTLFDATELSITRQRLEQAMVRLEDTAHRDGLTGIFNRRHLDALLEAEFARFRRYGNPFSILMIDLDHFKHVNDRHGHQAGDEVLREAAHRVAAGIRTSDMLARYGGEEFAVLLAETPLEGALMLAQRLRGAIAESPVRHLDTDIPVTASLGVAEARSDMASHRELVEAADGALYLAKRLGRNRVVHANAAAAELAVDAPPESAPQN